MSDGTSEIQATQAEQKPMAQTDISDETVQTSVRRAVLTEKYEQKQDSTKQPYNTMENTAQHTVSSYIKTAKTAYNKSCKTIIDVETKPNLPENIEQNITKLDNTSIEQIRFIFEDDSVTVWYPWNCTDSTAQLSKIIDYYTSTGSFSSLFGKTVQCTGVNENVDHQHIEYPVPYENRTAHLRYTLYTKLKQIGQIYNTFQQTEIHLTNRTQTTDGTLTPRYLDCFATKTATTIWSIAYVMIAILCPLIFITYALQESTIGAAITSGLLSASVITFTFATAGILTELLRMKSPEDVTLHNPQISGLKQIIHTLKRPLSYINQTVNKI